MYWNEQINEFSACAEILVWVFSQTFLSEIFETLLDNNLKGTLPVHISEGDVDLITRAQWPWKYETEKCLSSAASCPIFSIIVSHLSFAASCLIFSIIVSHLSFAAFLSDFQHHSLPSFLCSFLSDFGHHSLPHYSKHCIRPTVWLVIITNLSAIVSDLSAFSCHWRYQWV